MMSDEVTYATLMLQDSARVRSNWDGNNLRKGEHVAQSSIWRGAALSLMTLCLLLVAGLVTLGIIFLQMSNDITSDSEKLNQLQKIIHPQQDNLSEPLNISRNGPSEEYLQSQISALLERQEQMATKLCKEFLIHTSDHKCNPCPKSWQWHGNSCYYFTIHEEKTWSDSRKDCTDKNATLVKIDSFRERNFLQSQPSLPLSFFWLGLSWNSTGRHWVWEDGSTPSPTLFSYQEQARFNGSRGCAYFERGNVYISRCSAEISWICEKTASLVKIEDLV
ncbi:C-type lectin domain family 12 member B [Cricetulus griseus]|uniref:C-type lectin domain family 12 member B n=2 Tax=Cricetulus griseus TaxID=10029 RepID=A0A061HWW7_CRIGR|nr:C-type lectin domain family 12 member B [Cricetulus griseus]XP_027285794.1 C-type lectin domain family 12 member B [Cricetulus griseus]ERE66438.1 C-type lectin domain family 12 member B-like protein [Cricetulus griseus]